MTKRNPKYVWKIENAKHVWTEKTAAKYVADVEYNRVPVGLKYCSAVDFLRKK